MHPSRRLVALAALAPLAVLGCTTGPELSLPTSRPSPSAAPVGPQADAAARIVRDGAPEVQPIVGTATLAAGNDADGCEFTVFSVTATATSTVVNWGAQCGDRKPSFDITRAEGKQHLPILRVGDVTYHVTRYQDAPRSGRSFPQHLAASAEFRPQAQPSSATYGPLPAGTTSVEISSPAFAAPITVPVTSPDPHEGGTADLPILARTAIPGETTMLASVHGIRRVPGATAVYYSLSTLDGGSQSAVAALDRYGNSTVYTPGWTELGSTRKLTNAFAALDHDRAVVVGQLGRNGQGAYGALAPGGRADGALRDAAHPLTFIAYLPALPATSTRIDLLFGGQLILQDLPVGDGAMTPTSTERFPALGTGWPTLHTDLLATLPEEESANVTSPLVQVVTDGTLTRAGDTLELNASALFRDDGIALSPDAGTTVTRAAASIAEAGDTGSITVTGHTDDAGRTSTSLDLSKRRAQAVADALRPHLPAGIAIAVDGKGETEPLADNATEAGRRANRRVTITLPE